MKTCGKQFSFGFDFFQKMIKSDGKIGFHQILIHPFSSIFIFGNQKNKTDAN